MLGSGKGMSGVVRISRNGSGAGTFPDKRPKTKSESVAKGANKLLVRVISEQFFEAIRVDRGNNLEQVGEGFEGFGDVMMPIVTGRHGRNRG